VPQGATLNHRRKRAVKDLEYSELDYYKPNRNEPAPPNASIVSAVKASAKKYAVVTSVTKTAVQRKETEQLVNDALDRRLAQPRSFGIPDYGLEQLNFGWGSDTTKDVEKPTDKKQQGSTTGFF